MKSALLLLCAISASTLAKPNGFYHQEYNYQTSSSHYKNRELQHKNDDAGFYSKDGDFEGRLRPKVNAFSQHSEYVNPKLQHAYHTGIDRTSSFGQLHAQNRFTPAEQPFGPDMAGAFSFAAPVQSYGVNSNLRQVTASLEAEMERELQRAVYDHYQRAAAYGETITQAQIEADRRMLEEELRRNVTMRLQEALREQYGSQGIRGGNSYSLIDGRLQPTANYNTQELADLTRQLEANLLKRLEQQVQTYYRVETAVHTQRNTYRHVNNNNNNNINYPSPIQQRPPVYQPYEQPVHIIQPQPIPRPQPQPIVVPQPQPIPVGHIPDSITTVATRVQTELNEHLNKILEDTQRRYFSENGFQTHSGINFDTILAQLQEDLRANITIQFDEQIKRTYGYSNYVASKYSVEDIENLRRQIENNLLTRLNRDFLRQRDNFLRTYQVYQQPRPIPSNQVQVFQPMNTVHFQGDISTLQRQMQEQLSRQLQQALLEQSYRQAHIYSGSNVNAQENYQATLEQLQADLNRNLTREWEMLNLQNYQSGIQSAQLANMRNQLQHDLMRQLQQGLQQSYSRYSSWSSSSSASSSGAHSAGSYRPVRGFDPNLYRTYGTGNVLGEDCMMGDDPSVYQQTQDDQDLTQQTEDLTQQAEDLTQQTQDDQDLTQQTEDLTQQAQTHDDLTQQSQDLTQQIEDLTQQTQTHDDLTQQAEDLTQQTQTHDDLTQQSQDLTQQSQDLTQQAQTHDDLTQQSQDLTQQTEDLTQLQEKQKNEDLRRQTQDFLDQIRTHDQTYQPQEQKRQTDLDKPVEVFEIGPSVSQNQGPAVPQEAHYENLDEQVQNQTRDLSQQTEDDLTQQIQSNDDLTQQVQQEDYNQPQEPLRTASLNQKPLTAYQQVVYQNPQDQNQQIQQQNRIDDLTQHQQQENIGFGPSVSQKPGGNQEAYLPSSNVYRPFPSETTQQTFYPTVNQQPPTYQTVPQVQRYQVQQTPNQQQVFAQEPVIVQQNRRPLYSRPQQYEVSWLPGERYQLPKSYYGSSYGSQGGVRQRVQYYEQLNRQQYLRPQSSTSQQTQTYLYPQTTTYRRFQPQTQQTQQLVDSGLTQQSQDLLGQQVDQQPTYPGFTPLQLDNQRQQYVIQPPTNENQLQQVENLQQNRDLTQQPTDQLNQQNSEGIAPLQIGSQVGQSLILPPQQQQTQNQLQLNQNQLPTNDNQLQQIEYAQNLQQDRDLTQQTEDQLSQQPSNEFAPLQLGNQQTQSQLNEPIALPALQRDSNLNQQTQLIQQQADVLANQQDDDLTQQVEDINVQPIEPQVASNQIFKDQESQNLIRQEIDGNQQQQQPGVFNQPQQQNQQQLANAQQESQNLIDLLKNQKRLNDERIPRNQELGYGQVLPTVNQQPAPIAQYSDDVQQPIQPLQYQPKPVYTNGREEQIGTTRQLPNYGIPEEEHEANTETTRDIEPIEPQIANQVQEVAPVAPVEPIEEGTTKKPGFWSRVGSSIKNKLG